MARWGSTDANEAEIVGLLNAIPGVTVAKLSQVGGGVPDLLVGHRGRNFLFEIKDPNKPPSGRKLTPAQVKFHDTWRGQVQVAHTFGEILSVIQDLELNGESDWIR